MVAEKAGRQPLWLPGGNLFSGVGATLLVLPSNHKIIIIIIKTVPMEETTKLKLALLGLDISAGGFLHGSHTSSMSEHNVLHNKTVRSNIEECMRSMEAHSINGHCCGIIICHSASLDSF